MIATKISKYVFSKLSERGVTVGNMQVPAETNLPFIVFEKTQHSIDSATTSLISEAAYNVIIVSKSYAEALEIADATAESFRAGGSLDGMMIYPSYPISMDERIDENGVYQFLIEFKIRLTEEKNNS